MAVRNFWIDADIDGRKSKLSGGPRSKDGGFDMTIYIRDTGGSVTALEIIGRVAHDGKLRILARNAYNNNDTIEIVSTR